MMVKMNKYIGSDFDDFLEEESLLIEASSEALERLFLYKRDCDQKKDNFED